MLALFRATNDQRWLDAASRGSQWLAAGVGKDGYWPSGDYQSDQTPSYYTRCRLADVSRSSRNRSERSARSSGFVSPNGPGSPEESGRLRGLVRLRQEKRPSRTPSPTPIRGLQESANILGGEEGKQLWEACHLPLEKLCRHAEIYNGHLPGAYGENWKADRGFTCLTGNLPKLRSVFCSGKKRAKDIRLVNAAAKLVDDVCRSQALKGLQGSRGGVAGSRPLWQRYMRLRYPNWAAKYHCDALMRLIAKIREIASCDTRSE